MTSAREWSSVDLEEVPYDDKVLTLAFQRGEKGAYQAIYDRYHTRVQSICRRMLSNPDDAHEAAQETFLRTYQALARFNGRYQLGAWIGRIATNICLDHLRARSRSPVLPTDELPESGSEEQWRDADPANIYLKSLEGKRIVRVLDSLPPLHRAAIVLRDFEGFSYEEVATALSITECQVKALIHRARKSFKRSWVSAFGILAPARIWSRLAERLRTSELAGSEHAAQALGASTPVVCVCHGVLQQVGQTMGTGLMRAGSALVGVALAATNPGVQSIPDRLPEKREVVVADGTAARGDVSGDHDSRNGESEALLTPTPEPAPAETSTPEPAPSPTPLSTPTSTAEEGIPSAPQESPGPQPSPSPTSVVGPPSASVGFDSGSAYPSSIPTRYIGSADCGAYRVDQDMEIDVHDGQKTYSGRLRLWVRSNVSVELTVNTGVESFQYVGGGSFIKETPTDSGISLSFSGYYSTGNAAAGATGLPESGRFTADLTLDCTTRSVVSETLLFGR